MTLLVLAALLCAPAQESMTVTFLEGSATASGRSLEEGAILQEGETIETQAGGRIEIAVPGGTLIRLGESSRLTLSAAEPRKRFSARLLLGNLWTRVHKLLDGESFQIETENGVAGVRGTEFRVAVAADQPDLVRVYEGAVQVQSRDARWSHQVGPGSELRFRREAEPPRAFDPAAEKSHPFLEWVRERDSHRPEQEQRHRENIREHRQKR
jgi:ferric-dicitrate binding protein FerR (iron transport regulator)